MIRFRYSLYYNGYTLKRFYFSLRNWIDYPLRQLFRWRRKGFSLSYQSKEHLFDDEPADQQSHLHQKEHEYRNKYHLEMCYEQSSCRQYREILFYLESLERTFSSLNYHLPDRIICADIGVSTWFYVQGLYRFLQYWQTEAARDVRLEGYEADAYRIYPDLFSRYDKAITYIGELAGIVYHAKWFQSQPEKFQVVTLFFPFVFQEDHLEWGLPANTFQPTDLLKSTWESVAPGGVLMVMNQGIEEHKAQQAMWHYLEIPVYLAFQFNSPMFHYSIERYILAGVKNG